MDDGWVDGSSSLSGRMGAWKRCVAVCVAVLCRHVSRVTTCCPPRSSPCPQPLPPARCCCRCCRRCYRLRPSRRRPSTQSLPIPLVDKLLPTTPRTNPIPKCSLPRPSLSPHSSSLVLRLSKSPHPLVSPRCGCPRCSPASAHRLIIL